MGAIFRPKKRTEQVSTDSWWTLVASWIWGRVAAPKKGARPAHLSKRKTGPRAVRLWKIMNVLGRLCTEPQDCATQVLGTDHDKKMWSKHAFSSYEQVPHRVVYASMNPTRCHQTHTSQIKNTRGERLTSKHPALAATKQYKAWGERLTTPTCNAQVGRKAHHRWISYTHCYVTPRMTTSCKAKRSVCCQKHACLISTYTTIHMTYNTQRMYRAYLLCSHCKAHLPIKNKEQHKFKKLTVLLWDTLAKFVMQVKFFSAPLLRETVKLLDVGITPTIVL